MRDGKRMVFGGVVGEFKGFAREWVLMDRVRRREGEVFVAHEICEVVLVQVQVLNKVLPALAVVLWVHSASGGLGLEVGCFS